MKRVLFDGMGVILRRSIFQLDMRGPRYKVVHYRKFFIFRNVDIQTGNIEQGFPLIVIASSDRFNNPGKFELDICLGGSQGGGISR